MGQGQGRTEQRDDGGRDLDRVADGGNEAVVEQHLPLVGHIVFQLSAHFPRHVDREELSRAGALGLVEAARRFDPDRGVPFARFAAQRIRGAILDALRDADWAPRSLRTAARRVESARQSFIHEWGRSPSLEELGTATGLSPAELNRLEDRVFRSVVLTLDEVVSADDHENLTLVDVLPDQRHPAPDEGVEDLELRSYLRDAVHLLPERHRLVVIGYFLEGRTSRDLARFLAVTESRISQLRAEALEMLRDGIGAQYEAADQDAARIPAGLGGRVARRKAAYAAAIADQRSWRSRVTLATNVQDAHPPAHAPSPEPAPPEELDLRAKRRPVALSGPAVALAAS